MTKTHDTSLSFGPFRLDSEEEVLWKGSERLVVKPKAFAVLRYLVDRPQQLVKKQDLLEALWPETAVGDAVLKNCIAHIRQVLGDQAEHPTFIETVHGRGYRFLGATPPQTTQTPQASSAIFIGREQEFSQLTTFWQKMLQGERQVVFVTGEPGIGKTSLVNAFVATVRRDPGVRIGRGQCLEQYGAGEPYLPFLEILSRLCRQPGGEALVTLLHQYAPTWMVQLPGLLDPADFQAVLPKAIGATPIRMMRELADVFEMFTQDQPLILCLEDVHWLDPSSTELVNYLARRSGLAHLFVLGTYRPVDVVQLGHPLKAIKQDLQVHGLCQELPLDPLTELDIEEYLISRLIDDDQPGQSFTAIARNVHEHTEGNPLFMVNVVDFLVSQDLLIHTDQTWQLLHTSTTTPIPAGLRQFLELRMERLEAVDREILETASVAGREFSTPIVAAALEMNQGEIEQRCQALGQHQHFIEETGTTTWPDGTVATNYMFSHALYQNTLYDGILPTRRTALHRHMGERRVQAYGERCREIAPELALHFERGHAPDQASLYHQQAGEDAFKRSAPQEAVVHLKKALEFLETLPAKHEHVQRELQIQSSLGLSLFFAKNFGASEAGQAFGRSLELVHQSPTTPHLFPVLLGLLRYYGATGQAKMALDIAEQLINLAEISNDPTLLALAHETKGVSAVFAGDFFTAQRQIEHALSIDLPDSADAFFLQCGEDPRIIGPSFLGFALWARGYPNQARKILLDEITATQNHTFTTYHGMALFALGVFHRMSGDSSAGLKVAEQIISFSDHEGIRHTIYEGQAIRGWAQTMLGGTDEGITNLETAASHLITIGQRSHGSIHMASIAEACLRMKRYEQGLATVTEGLQFAEETGNRWFEAELHRLKGELILAAGQSGDAQSEQEAESCFHDAITVAQKQDANMLELRAALSLCRLWQHQGKVKQARQALQKIYDGFTEGFDTKDLQDAKAFLDSLD